MVSLLLLYSILCSIQEANVSESGGWYIGEHIVLYRPVLVAQQFVGGVYSQVSCYFQSSMFYLSTEDGDTVMIEVQETPEIYIQQLRVQEEPQQDEATDEGEPQITWFTMCIQRPH